MGSSLKDVTHAWPYRPTLVCNQPNMMRAFLHLTCQINSCGDDQVWVCSSYFDLQVEPAEVQLGRCHSLLSYTETLPKAGNFCKVLLILASDQSFGNEAKYLRWLMYMLRYRTCGRGYICTRF
jgi:hypothetical protein